MAEPTVLTNVLNKDNLVFNDEYLLLTIRALYFPKEIRIHIIRSSISKFILPSDDSVTPRYLKLFTSSTMLLLITNSILSFSFSLYLITLIYFVLLMAISCKKNLLCLANHLYLLQIQPSHLHISFCSPYRMFSLNQCNSYTN